MYRFSLPHLRIWNSIDLNYRNISTYSGFKRTLINKTNVNKWHCFGKKNLNIIHTNLRHRYSSLNYDAILRMNRTVFLLSCLVYAACLTERHQIPIL